MTNTQISKIKRGQVVRNLKRQKWTALADAYVPPRDTVNYRVPLTRTVGVVKWVRTLTCTDTEF